MVVLLLMTWRLLWYGVWYGTVTDESQEMEKVWRGNIYYDIMPSQTWIEEKFAMLYHTLTRTSGVFSNLKRPCFLGCPRFHLCDQHNVTSTGSYG